MNQFNSQVHLTRMCMDCASVPKYNLKTVLKTVLIRALYGDKIKNMKISGFQAPHDVVSRFSDGEN